MEFFINQKQYPTINGTRIFGNSHKIINNIKGNLSYKINNFDEEFEDIKFMLNPSLEFQDQRTPIKLDDKQKELARAFYPEEKKIKGYAGSGKTMVLAVKALDAFKQTGNEVLILSFNITLRNYIKDIISRNLKHGEKIPDKFNIIHFHRFIFNLANNYNIKIKGGLDINEQTTQIINEITNHPKEPRKYDTIVIDEAQDFQYSWFEFIKNKILHAGGSYTIFGDEKQNIFLKTNTKSILKNMTRP